MKYISLLLILLLAACGQHSLVPDHTEALLSKSDGQLVPIADTDTAYTNYYNMQPVTTPRGWNITYMVKNDSTRFTDAYIQWQKGDVKRVYKYEHVLQFRPSFLPQFTDEDEGYIYMEHWCATECQAITVLPKNATEKNQTFDDVLGYDIGLGQIVYRIHSENDGELVIAATDLKRKVTKQVTFKNKYYSPINPMQDSPIFKGDRIIINWVFYGEEHEAEETQVIQF